MKSTMDEDENVDEGEETTDDDESQSDKTEDGESENEDGKDDEKAKTRRSEIAQKKHWREKAKKSNARVAELEAELTNLRSTDKKPDDEKERAAQEYIDGRIRTVAKELELAKQKEEAKTQANFEETVEELLDENPDIAEDDLLDTIEEYEVEPKTALRILRRQSKDTKEKKPKMPKPRNASSGDDKDKKAPDDSKKSMWEILKEEKEKLMKK